MLTNNFKFNTLFGIDGTKNGWVLSFYDYYYTIEFDFVDDLSSFFNHFPSSLIFIDMPTFLPDSIELYPKLSERLAKKFLGKKHSSIFYAPLSTWLSMEYQDINRLCDSHDKPKLSKQSFYLFPKISSIQMLLTNYSKHTIREGHPECFFSAKGIVSSKKTKEGIFDRLKFLQLHFSNIDTKISHFMTKNSCVTFDDCLDSAAMLLLAQSFNSSSAQSFDNDIFY